MMNVTNNIMEKKSGVERMKMSEFNAMLNSDIWTEEDQMPLYTIFTMNYDPWYCCWLIAAFPGYMRK
jgi:hypothetical protein